MTRALEYQGYYAKVDMDVDLGLFRGQVINTASHIDFYSDSVDGLKSEFKTSVDEYLAVCEERGIAPEKGYSGKFNLRLGPELHAKASTSAAMSGRSLNEFIVAAVARATDQEEGEAP